MRPKKLQVILIIFVSVFLFSLRMIHLSADPPANLSASAGEYGDPGGYSYNARNKIVFGKWELDKYNPMYISLLAHYVSYLSFKLFGVGIAQMNLVPVFFSVLVLILVAFVAQKSFGPFFGFLTFVFLGINYLFTMYSRVANRIMPMILFLILALFFFLLGEREKKWYFLAGVSSLLAYMSKGVCLYILLAFFLGFVVYLALCFRRREALVRFLYLFAGSSIAFVLFQVFVYLPHKDVFKDLSRINVSLLVPSKNVMNWLVNFWTRPSILFENMPVISVLASLYFVVLLYRIVHRPRGLALLDWILIFWFVGGFSYYAIVYQRVTRHFVPQIIPLVLLSGMFLRDFYQAGSITKQRKPKPIFGLFLFFWLFFPVSQLMNIVLPSLPRFFSDVWIATAILVAFCILLVLLVFWAYRLWPENLKLSFSSLQKNAVLFLVLILVFLFSGRRYLAWALHPEFKMKQVSQDLGELLENAAIAGLWAPVVCLENTHRAHESFPGYVNDEKDFLERFQITHVFSTSFFGEDRYFWTNFPEAMAKSRLIARYHIWRGPVFLYDLNPGEDAAQKEMFFEAERFTQPDGFPRYDPAASGRLSVCAEDRKKGFLVIAVPENRIPDGRFRAVFRLKKGGPLKNPESRIARIDVVSETAQKVLAVENISGREFLKDHVYQEFSFPVVLRKNRDVRFRVFSDGLTELWVDFIHLEEIDTTEDL